MMAMTYILLFAFLLTGIGTSDAYQCYECTTLGFPSDDDCREPTPDTTRSCTGICSKVVSGDDVSRDCTILCIEGRTFDGYIHCCNDRDYCNTGSRHQLGLSVGLVGTLIAIGWQMMYF